MPRLVLGSHQVYIDGQEFFRGCLAAWSEGGQGFEPVVGSLQFEKLSSKKLTCVMKQGRPFVRRSMVKPLKAFLKLALVKQRELLYEAGVYQFEGLPEADTIPEGEAVAAVEQEYLAEEPNWGGSESETSADSEGEDGKVVEEVHRPWSELPINEDLLGRRVRRKTLSGHIDHTVKCVKPIACEESRLGRELGPIWSVDWGTTIAKATRLVRWGDSQKYPELLIAVVFRETGKVYYAATELWVSPSACWLISNCENINEFFCRLPLLLTPSLKRVVLPHGCVILFVGDKENAVRQEVDDGMLRYGKDLLGIFGRWDGESELYYSCQIRGIVYSTQSDVTALVKGMCKYDASLGCRVIEIPLSCRKVSCKGEPIDVECYFDITCYSNRCMSEPMLNGSVAANIELGVAMLPSEDDRRDANTKWQSILAEAKACTVDKHVRQAWKLHLQDP